MPVVPFKPGDFLLADALGKTFQAAEVIGKLANTVVLGTIEQRLDAAKRVRETAEGLLISLQNVEQHGLYRQANPAAYTGGLPS